MIPAAQLAEVESARQAPGAVATISPTELADAYDAGEPLESSVEDDDFVGAEAAYRDALTRDISFRLAADGSLLAQTPVSAAAPRRRCRLLRSRTSGRGVRRRCALGVTVAGRAS